MTFPRSEYPSEAAGFHEPHVEWAGGGVSIRKQRKQVNGILITAGIAGGAATLSGILGMAGYGASLAEPPQDPMVYVYAALFFFSTMVVFFLAALSTAGRLLRHVHQCRVTMEAQDRGLIELGFDNQWLLARLNGRAQAAGDSGGTGRDGATLSPAANVYTLNSKRKEPFQ